MRQLSDEEEFFPGFAWAVPTAFAKALSCFRLEQGDVLYDTRAAYDMPWNEALPLISYSIQVKYPPRNTTTRAQASDEQPDMEERQTDSAAERNWKCSVSFTLTDHRQGESRLVSSTQGRLYAMLRTGDLTWVEGRPGEPVMPLLARDLHKYLNSPGVMTRVVDHFANSAPRAKNPLVFLTPYDRSRSLLWLKHLKLCRVLSNFKLSKVDFVTPAEVGLGTQVGFGPTVQIACFHLDHTPLSAVQDGLKSVLYKPSKNGKKSVDRFRLERHGYLHILSKHAQPSIGLDF